VDGGWLAHAVHGGWQLGAGAVDMSVVVTAVDSAAVHRAIAKVKTYSAGEGDTVVTVVDQVS
jgi:phage terminase large subunit GpA-like protein